MFTGIVEERGTLVDRLDLGTAARMRIHGPIVTGDAGRGDSIAVNGVCLTVVSVEATTFTADVMKETLDRSSLGSLDPGSPVNLERAATLASRMGGHLVQGHVDGVGTVLARSPDRHWEKVRIGLPAGLSRYVVEKGSIAVDGVSLTVTAVRDEPAWFEVSLVPTTLELTTLGRTGPGTQVNLEVDVLAKYVAKLTSVYPGVPHAAGHPLDLIAQTPPADSSPSPARQTDTGTRTVTP